MSTALKFHRSPEEVNVDAERRPSQAPSERPSMVGLPLVHNFPIILFGRAYWSGLLAWRFSTSPE